MSPMRIIASVLTILVLGACSSETELLCGRDTTYREATSTGTLRIPDDLSVPDESDSLRIPGALSSVAASAEADADADPVPVPVPVCLEESPAFSDVPQP